MRHATQEH